MRCTRFISCLAMVGVFVGLAVVPASAADPTVSATPNKKLLDAQTISVSASGFAADTSMAIVECPTTTVSPGACDLNTVQFTTTDSTGAYSDFQFTVARILVDGTDCALNGGCYIGTQDDQAVGPTAATLIKFDASVPPPPQLDVSVRFDKNPKVNSKGAVVIRGRVTCKNKDAGVEIDADLRQVYDRSIFESFGFAFLDCPADTTNAFVIPIKPSNGLFAPGPAVLRFQAFADSVFKFRRVEVNLNGRNGAARPTASKLTWR